MTSIDDSHRVVGSGAGTSAENILPDSSAEPIPPGLRECDQWIPWRYEGGGASKPSVDPATGYRASYKDEEIWRSIEEALDIARERDDVDGIGFVLTDTDPFVGWDLDDVRDPATGNESIPDQVWEIVRSVGGFWQVSVSGEGLRGFCHPDSKIEPLLDGNTSKADLPIERVIPDDTPSIEVYADNQYMTVSGFAPLTDPDRTGMTYSAPLYGSGEDIIREYLYDVTGSADSPDASESDDDAAGQGDQDDVVADDGGSSSITELGRQSAQPRQSKRDHEHIDGDWIDIDGTPTVEQVRATGFALKDEFRALWNGDDLHHNSCSEADHEFVSHLWYYCGDRKLVDQAFRRSERYGIRLRGSDEYSPWTGSSPKWEYGPYRESTIEGTRDNERYDGHYLDPE